MTIRKCYKPALSPQGWCMDKQSCGKDLSKCPLVLGPNSSMRVVRTKKGALYPYTVKHKVEDKKEQGGS